MKSNIKYDIKKCYKIIFETEKPSIIKKIYAWIYHFELHIILIYRMGKKAQKLLRKIPPVGFILFLIYIVLDYLVRLIHHVEIHRNSVIGPGFYLGHPSSIYIGPVTIGKNCSVTHNVTIGFGLSGGKEGYPAIGDNVWIGPGAVLSGAIEIGNSTSISALTFVGRSIPGNCLVAGNPGRVVNSQHNSLDFLNFSVED